jgi:hypothetical protein
MSRLLVLQWLIFKISKTPSLPKVVFNAFSLQVLGRQHSLGSWSTAEFIGDELALADVAPSVLKISRSFEQHQVLSLFFFPLS